MHLKFKGIIGTISLVLGVILVISGTFGAFNDIEVINNTLAVGFCKLDANNPSLEISGLIPGEAKESTIIIKNSGTLSISHIKLFITYYEHDPGSNGPKGPTADDDFAQKIKVELSTDSFSHDDSIEENSYTLFTLKANPIQLIDILDNGSFLFEGDSETIYMRTMLIEEKGIQRFQDDSMKVRFTIEAICGEYEPPEEPDVPGVWDKSSLNFPDGEVGIDEKNNIFAIIKNGSDNDMQGPVNYEVYWSRDGNPKEGIKVGEGTLQLDAEDSTTLTYNPSLNPYKNDDNGSGKYKFKAYQRPGHGFQLEKVHVLWSDSITVP